MKKLYFLLVFLFSFSGMQAQFGEDLANAKSNDEVLEVFKKYGFEKQYKYLEPLRLLEDFGTFKGHALKVKDKIVADCEKSNGGSDNQLSEKQLNILEHIKRISKNDNAQDITPEQIAKMFNKTNSNRNEYSTVEVGEIFGVLTSISEIGIARLIVQEIQKSKVK